MSSMQVTQRNEFECSYLMKDNTFRSVHYRVEVTVEGNQHWIDEGMVIEFTHLSEIVKSVLPDRCFVYQNAPGDSSLSGSNITGSPTYTTEMRLAGYMQMLEIRTAAYPFVISAENLCRAIGERVQDKLNLIEPGVTVVGVKLRETTDSFASWKPEA